MDIYQELLNGMGDLREAEETDYCGLDEVMGDSVRVAASLGDLSEFLRISNDTLVHKAERDLWRISEDKKGQVIVERLFNSDGKTPIKV